MSETVWQFIRKDRQAAAGCIILGVWILMAILVPLFWPFSYSEQNAEIQNQSMSLVHWFGTDKFGRDLFARVWFGAGISLLIGMTSALLNGVIGILYGAVSGYLGRGTDLVMMRIADVVCSIPSMLYVILLTLVMGAGVKSMILGLCVAGWVDMARITRGEIIRLKGTDFACAARMEGISPVRILFRHLLPNAAGPAGESDLPDPSGDIYRGIPQFPRGGNPGSGGKSGYHHSGSTQPDAPVSVSDGLSPSGAVCDDACA